MKIEKIDSNFVLPEIKELEDIEWFDVLDEPFAIYGVEFDYDAGEFRRIPLKDCEGMRAQITELAANTAGGRVRFVTDSPYIALSCVTENNGMTNRFTVAGTYGFSVHSDGVFKGLLAPKWKLLAGEEGEAFQFKDFRRITEEGDHEILLFMPLYGKVRSLHIGLRKGSVLKPAKEYKYKKPVVFYGSSITQGGCASRSGNDYIGQLSRMLDTDVLNLGFSGNAKGEQSMANYLASLSPSVYVIDYDHNAPTVEHLRNTHYRLYETIRAAHPNTPIILMTRPDFESGEDSVGLRGVVLDTYKRAINQNDQNVAFVDGEMMFGKNDRELCTVDTRHPNDLGFYRMAHAVHPVLAEYLRNSFYR